MPHLPRFMQTYPDVQLDLTLLDRHTDIISEGVDVAIRIGELNDSSLVARKMGITRRVLVASPEYLKQYAQPQRLVDLQQHNCLVNTHHSTLDSWHFHHDNKALSVQVKGNMRANTGYALKDWVLADMGISILPTWLIAEELARGALLTLLSPSMSPTSKTGSTTARLFSVINGYCYAAKTTPESMPTQNYKKSPQRLVPRTPHHPKATPRTAIRRRLFHRRKPKHDNDRRRM